ncbi:putative R-linalool synthase [Helianthus annuus]|nr:putative R-linalool synthase [Helianthus annuus]
MLINLRIHVLPYLKKPWADLCESYLREARWYHSGHTPTLNDYLNNACVTIGSPLTLMYMKILTSGNILGDIPKSIQCYMHESGATEDEARRHIKNLTLKTWKKLNKERANAKSQLLHETIDYAMDIVRMAQFMYGKGDGHGRPNVTKFVYGCLY